MSAEFHRTYNYAQDIKVMFSHVNEEPAMGVCRESWGKKNAFIVGLSNAYKYTDDDYLVEHAMIAVITLGLTPSRDNAKLLADILQQHIGELVLMPPAKEEDTRAIVENAIERHGLKVNLNGENVLGHF